MKAVALFQFYFPYVLPRESDWQGAGMIFQLPEFTVRVRPRGFEEELFPNEIDKTLATMQMVLLRLSLPVGSGARVVRDLCYDRIEVVVEGEVSSSEDVKQPDLQAEYRDVAIRCCNLFIDHCRVVTRAPFLVGVKQHYRLQDGKYYVLTPHSISWFDGDSGDSLPAYKGDVNSVATSGAVRSPERGLASMRAIQQSIEQGIQPDLIHSLLLDAEERLVTLRIREAVISLATACEVASNIYIRHQGREDDDQIRKILRQRASFAEKRFHLITTLLTKKSLKQENPETFDLVEKAYRTRNGVAHEGRAFYKDGSLEVEVDVVLATKFLAAARKAVDWLASL